MGYHFSTDFLTGFISVWESVLKRYKGLPNLRFLEIGTFEGRSAIWMLENVLTHPSSKLTLCDTFVHDTEYILKHNLKESGQEKRTEIIKTPSCEALRKLPLDTFDIIYIDGSHLAKNALSDIVLSWDLLKTNGIMIIDDYNLVYRNTDLEYRLDELFRPKIAVDVFLYVRRDDIKILHKDYQVIICKQPCIEKSEELGFYSPLGNPAGAYQYDWVTRRLLNSDLEMSPELNRFDPNHMEEFIKYRSTKKKIHLQCLRDKGFRMLLIKMNMAEWL